MSVSPVRVTRYWPDDQQGPWAVDFDLELVDGQVMCVGVAVHGKDPGRRRVTQDVIRRLPIARLLDDVRRDQPREVDQLVGLPPIHKVIDEARYNIGLLARRERGVYDEAFFRDVAKVYRSAVSKPTTHVADVFAVPVTTAANWVRRARGMGLIPPHERTS